MEKPLTVKYAEAIKSLNSNWQGSVSGNAEEDFVIDWNGEAEISVADIQAKITEMDAAEANEVTTKANLKASAKAKLMAGEALTEDEASMLVI